MVQRDVACILIFSEVYTMHFWFKTYSITDREMETQVQWMCCMFYKWHFTFTPPASASNETPGHVVPLKKMSASQPQLWTLTVLLTYVSSVQWTSVLLLEWNCLRRHYSLKAYEKSKKGSFLYWEVYESIHLTYQWFAQVWPQIH